MDTDKGQAKQEILIRLLATLILVLITVVLWAIGNAMRTDDWRVQWLNAIGSGLIVLGVAGIWVSYFAERQAGKNISRKVDDRFSILASCYEAGIQRVHKTRNDHECTERLVAAMEKSSTEIRIIAIAAREFLHQGITSTGSTLYEWKPNGDFSLYGRIEQISRKQDMKFLLLHPWCEQALSRGLREDPMNNEFSKYTKTRLFEEVNRSWETLGKWLDDGSRIQARLFTVMPCCLLVITSDVLFVEHYHFGSIEKHRAAGMLPVFEVRRGSRLYEQYEGHFKYVWDTSERVQLLPGVQPIRDISDKQQRAFKEAMHFLRPDLFPPTHPH